VCLNETDLAEVFVPIVVAADAKQLERLVVAEADKVIYG